MPRHSLEALMAGAKIIVPSGIPEFEDTTPEIVNNGINSHALAKQIIDIGSKESIKNKYPISKHLPENVINQYIDLFGKIKKQKNIF